MRGVVIERVADPRIERVTVQVTNASFTPVEIVGFQSSCFCQPGDLLPRTIGALERVHLDVILVSSEMDLPQLPPLAQHGGEPRFTWFTNLDSQPTLDTPYCGLTQSH